MQEEPVQMELMKCFEQQQMWNASDLKFDYESNPCSSRIEMRERHRKTTVTEMTKLWRILSRTEERSRIESSLSYKPGSHDDEQPDMGMGMGQV